MEMRFLRKVKRKMRRDRIRNEAFRNELELTTKLGTQWP